MPTSPGPLAPGDVVTVYQDPITRENEEGTAILVQCLLEEDEGLSYWKVRFLGDPSFGFLRRIPAEAERWIFRPMQGNQIPLFLEEPISGEGDV